LIVIIHLVIVFVQLIFIHHSLLFNRFVLHFLLSNFFYVWYPVHLILNLWNQFLIGLIYLQLVNENIFSFISKLLIYWNLVPYFITLIVNRLDFYKEISPKTYFCLSLLRIFRFIRVFKLYRIFQHVKSLRVLASTLKESIPDFIILLSFLTISGFLFGAASYFAENDINERIFDSIPKATYYGIITLTAVG
jgi:hypothetical protein